MIMGRGSRVLRALLFFGIIWISSVGVLAHRATRATTRTTVVSNEKYEHCDLIGRCRRHHNHQDSDFHFVIKRRVPNGADPIHNRGASLSRKPPGRT